MYLCALCLSLSLPTLLRRFFNCSVFFLFLLLSYTPSIFYPMFVSCPFFLLL
jgi:hypothetical protein